MGKGKIRGGKGKIKGGKGKDRGWEQPVAHSDSSMIIIFDKA